MAALDPASLNYFEIESAPGLRMFRCEQYRTNLTEHGCATRFRAAKQAVLDDEDERFVTYHHCARCPVGAHHAGEAPVRPLIVGGLVCARCGDSASRLIYNTICVPCYNRAREVARGANSKGTKPQPVDRFWQVGESDDTKGPRASIVRPVRVFFSSGSARPAEVTVSAATTIESVIVVARSLPPTDPLPRFRRAMPRVQLRQASLFGGC